MRGPEVHLCFVFRPEESVDTAAVLVVRSTVVALGGRPDAAAFVVGGFGIAVASIGLVSHGELWVGWTIESVSVWTLHSRGATLEAVLTFPVMSCNTLSGAQQPVVLCKESIFCVMSFTPV